MPRLFGLRSLSKHVHSFPAIAYPLLLQLQCWKAGDMVVHLFCAGNMTWESLQVGSNIKLIEWAPQTDVLAHPGVQAFLTQSGLNGLYEAAFHAVPMVSVPFIGDQINNAGKVIPSRVKPDEKSFLANITALQQFDVADHRDAACTVHG